MRRRALTRDYAGVVIITGGSSGIGRCTGALFGRRGWRVGLIARGAEGLAVSRADLEALGAQAATAQADVTNRDALAAAAQAIVETLGPVDLWINCAGNGVYGRFVDVPMADFERVTEVTYHGVVNGTRVALAHMTPRRRGCVVNVCSAVAFHGLPMMSSYAGAKAAVRGFSQALQGELKLDRMPIRVATVFPPAANTPFFSHAVSYMGWPARPAAPVYRPEIVAQGIWQAAHNGRSEMTISGTATAFSFASRMAPGLVAWCMEQFGIDRQVTRDAEMAGLLEPTLFQPSRQRFEVHGPFHRHCRSWSSQLWLERRRSELTGLFSRSQHPARGPGAARSTPRPVRPGPAARRAGLDEQSGVS